MATARQVRKNRLTLGPMGVSRDSLDVPDPNASVVPRRLDSDELRALERLRVQRGHQRREVLLWEQWVRYLAGMGAMLVGVG